MIPSDLYGSMTGDGGAVQAVHLVELLGTGAMCMCTKHDTQKTPRTTYQGPRITLSSAVRELDLISFYPRAKGYLRVQAAHGYTKV